MNISGLLSLWGT